MRVADRATFLRAPMGKEYAETTLSRTSQNDGFRHDMAIVAEGTAGVFNQQNADIRTFGGRMADETPRATILGQAFKELTLQAAASVPLEIGRAHV